MRVSTRTEPDGSEVAVYEFRLPVREDELERFEENLRRELDADAFSTFDSRRAEVEANPASFLDLVRSADLRLTLDRLTMRFRTPSGQGFGATVNMTAPLPFPAARKLPSRR